MKISIAQRLRPFSHRLGTLSLIPFSTWTAQLYPTRIILQKIGTSSPCIALDLTLPGPFTDFTVQLDLERGQLSVFGSSPQGYLRYAIMRSPSGILFCFEKIPSPPLSCTLLSSSTTYQVGEKETLLIPVSSETSSVPSLATRLSLGMHKAQDWDLILRRFDLKEILPILMRLGSMIPCPVRSDEPLGTLTLLDAFERAVTSRNKLAAISSCTHWLRTSFTGILVPTLTDLLFQGILPFACQTSASDSALLHLTRGSYVIRSLFFEERENQWEILPCLLSPFAAGRLTHLTTREQEVVHIEWSKHQLKKMVVVTHQPRTQIFKLPKEISSFRLRTSLEEKGRTVHLPYREPVKVDFPEKGQLFFDRFEK